jgi:hypothetical protein
MAACWNHHHVDSARRICRNVSVRLLIIAIAVAIAMPVSTLRTMTVVTSCCCPDPSHCHCPDHKKSNSKAPTIRACHKTAYEYVTPELAAFEPTEIAIAAPERPEAITVFPTSTPHEAPAPARPDAPS